MNLDIIQSDYYKQNWDIEMKVIHKHWLHDTYLKIRKVFGAKQAYKLAFQLMRRTARKYKANMFRALKAIWTASKAVENHKRENMNKAVFKKILRLLRGGPKTSKTLLESTGMSRTSLYTFLAVLTNNKEIHCGEGMGKFYGLIGDELPRKSDPAKEFAQNIYDFLAVSCKIQAIRDKFPEVKHSKISYHLRTLRGLHGFEKRIELHDWIYSQTGGAT